MKRLIAATLIATVTATSAFAHGGGLNREGCHHKHSNNTYHCHRQQQQSSDDWEQALGALLLLGLVGAAITEASCNKDWRVLENHHNYVVIGEVNCRGQILQKQVVYR